MESCRKSPGDDSKQKKDPASAGSFLPAESALFFSLLPFLLSACFHLPQLIIEFFKDAFGAYFVQKFRDFEDLRV